ncbi:MAG: hypothetical protein MUO72_12405 [Bacteroidales bacterium]|nr:hypothetical protein [Bacteroidales bacterium]
MKKSSIILGIVFLFAVCFRFQGVNAQEKSKEEKEKELQELIIEQKKAMKDQQKAQEEMQKALQESKVEIDQAMEDAKVEDKVNRAMRVYSDGFRNRPLFNNGEPFVFTPVGEFGHAFTGESERTSWDFSKSVKETSFSRDYTFDVEPTVNTVVMSVNGDCKAGEIRIKIIMPNGKTYSDIIIDEFGNLNWRKSFTISETENKDKSGAWKFDISSSKATGYFKISLQTY